MNKNSVPSFTHPDYDASVDDWYKFRLTYQAGTAFKDKYLEHFSSREDYTDFANRKAISYVPAHAKAAINDVKNAIFQRLIDITRAGGPDSYQNAITGNNGGIDLAGNSMDSFIGRIVLPELLVMGKVGIYVDKPEIPATANTLDKQAAYRPYIYIYKAENIRCWGLDKQNQLQSVLLRDYIEQENEQGLVIGTIEQYRLIRKTPEGVIVSFYDQTGQYVNEIPLKIKKIPFVILEITGSLLTDVADYQIALLNLSSSDMNYAFRGNFPFYTEQSTPADMLNMRQADASTTDSNPGTDAEAQKARDPEIKVGATKGRRYAKGTERPAFIHPSPEPLRVSMEKQEKMKQEIRQLINLAITNIEPRRASAESKTLDEKGLESGLSYIGLELEYAEREVGRLWAEYENLKNPDVPTIQYPKKYTLKTDEDRRKEAKEITEQAEKVPSKTFQKESMKAAVSMTMGYKVTAETLAKMHQEIDESDIVIINPEVINQSIESGILCLETASKAMGYPEGEIDKAKKDKADRAAAVALAQSTAGARGVADLSTDPKLDAKLEKERINAQNNN